MFLQDTIPALVNQFPAAAEAWPAMAYAGAVAVSIGGVVSGLTGWWKTVLEIRSLRPQAAANSSAAAGASSSILIATTDEVRRYDQRIRQLEARSRRFGLLACVGFASTLAVSVGGTASMTDVATAPPWPTAPATGESPPAAMPDEPVVVALDTIPSDPGTTASGGEGVPPASRPVPTETVIGRGVAGSPDFPDSTVERRLAEVSALLADQGFGDLAVTRRGALTEGRESRFPLALLTGAEHFVVAACDLQCSAMTLELRHPSGILLSSDDASDDRLALAFTPTEDTAYLLSARMDACSVAPCRFGIRIYRR